MGQEGRCLRLWARKPRLASLSCPSRGAHAVWILTLMGRPTAQPLASSQRRELLSGELLTRMKPSPANPGSQKHERVTMNATLIVARVTEPEEASPLRPPRPAGLCAFTLSRLQHPRVPTLQACVSDAEAHRSWALHPRGVRGVGQAPSPCASPLPASLNPVSFTWPMRPPQSPPATPRKPPSRVSIRSRSPTVHVTA